LPVFDIQPNLTNLTNSKVAQQANAPAEKKVSPDDFNFVQVLGKGNYGKVIAYSPSPSLSMQEHKNYKQVMLATMKDDPSGKLYAVKVIKKSGLVDDESLEHVLSENKVLQTMDHPFLVKLYLSFQTIVSPPFLFLASRLPFYHLEYLLLV